MGSAHSPSFSPDGTQIAYVSDASGLPQVWISPVAGGEPIQVTNLPDPVQSVRWSPAGDWIAYDVAPGGGLNVQIYLRRPDGSETKLLTAGGEINNTLGPWAPNGLELAFGTNQLNPANLDAFLADPETGEIRAVGRAEGLTAATDVSRNGDLAVVSRLCNRSDNNLFLVNLEKQTETLLTPHRPPATSGWGAFSQDGRRVYVTSNAVSDMTAFGTIDLDADGHPGEMRILATRSDAEAESAALDLLGQRAALVWNVAGRSELTLLDIASGAQRPVSNLPCEIVTDLTFSADGRKLAFAGLGAVMPSDIWVLDVASGRLTKITRSSHDGIDLATLARPTLVTYPAFDQLPLSGWLYRPEGARGPGPLVFIYHGGPEGQSRPQMDANVQALVARGISVFLPNVRGSTGFGKNFANLDNGRLRFNAIRDIAATTNALVAKGVAAPGRLGIMGGSYGGYMAMAGITEYPDMFAAAANLFGVVNFASFFEHTEPWMAAISKVKYGDPDSDAELLRSLSPIHRLDRIKTPLIVLHGANDTNVPVIETEELVVRLRARGVHVDYVLFPDEGHGWRRLPNRIHSTMSLAEFFDRRLNA
jgi:dipeptidyl aminopeptidase/acylaminoacyl peptidase